MIKKNNYGLYFLNNLYDDNIINDFIGNFRNRLYTDILDGKKHIQKNVIQSGKISDFKIDNDFNEAYGLPYGSYIMSLPYDVVPYYSEHAFVKKYGFGKIVSFNEVMNDVSIFTKSIYLFIGSYFIYDIKFVFEKHLCKIIIPNVNEFATKLFNSLNITNWAIAWASKSDYYYTYLSRVNLVSGNKIYVSSLTTKKIYNKTKSNYWTVYLSNDNTFPNKMVAGNATYVEDPNGDYFLLDQEFISNAVQNVPTIKCLIVNNPSCTGTGEYIRNMDTSPIFQIPYKKNPIPVENITLWAYDTDTKQKKYPIIAKNVGLTYPNIYDFEKTFNEYNESVYLEWLEPTDDISAFNTYIKNYMDCYIDNYATMIMNKTADSRVIDYKPIDFINFSSEEYFKSEYYGDNRAWRLSKLVTMLKDNPMLYEELLKYICYLNREFVSMSYSYETDAHIYERSIMDNRHHCDNADERLMVFDEPHTYIKTYNSDCSDRYCTLFIDGVRKDITYDMTFGSDMYVYFPVSYIQNHEPIHLVVYLDNGKVVDQTFEIAYTGGYYDFEEPETLQTNSLADLVYYDDATGEFLDTSYLHYRLRVETFDFKYNGYDNLDEYAPDSYHVLWSSDEETVQPTDFDFIILGSSKEKLDIEGINYHKKINMADVEFVLDTNPYYDGKTFHVATTSFYTIRTFTITDEMVQNGFTLKINNFKGKYMKTRYHLFLDGIIVNPNLYDIKFPMLYGGDVEIINPKFGPGRLTVEYISYDELVVFNGKIGDLRKTDDNILYLDDILDLPLNIDMYTIYVDGYRISNDQIRTIGQNNMITIHTHREITDDSEILIYTQEYDEDPYEYETNLHFLSEVSKTDDTFRSYLLETFDK